MLLIDTAVFLLTLLVTANAGVVKYNIVNKRDTTKYVQPVTGGFAATIQVGNPPQDVQVGFDTGSFNLVVLAENVTCDEGSCPGTFNVADSSSARITNQTFSFQYSGGDGAHGNMLYDTVTVGGLEIRGAPVGYSYGETVDGYAVFGLADRDSLQTPLKSMVNSGAISRKVFSTYTIPSGDGAVVFGGVDTAKYSSLGTVPFTTDGQGVPYYVEISAISTSCGPVVSNKFTAILDTGSDANIVPNDVFHEIHQSFKGKVASEPIADLPNPESYVFKCKDAHPLLVDFSGAIVEIPVQNFLLPLTSNGSPLLDEEKDELCSTMIFNNLNEGMYIFGSNFLNGLYIVWDLDSKTLSLGNTIDTTEENIVELTDSTIPKAFTAPGSSSVVGISTTNAETTTLTAESISYGFLTTSIAEIACTLAVESSSPTSTGFSFSLSSSSFASKLVVSTGEDGIITRHQSTTVTAQSATCLKCETSSSRSSSSSSSSSTVSTIYRSATTTVTSFTCLACTTISPRSSSASPSSSTTTLLPESSVSTASSSSSESSSIPAITSTSTSSLSSSPSSSLSSTSSSFFLTTPSESTFVLSSSSRSSPVVPSSTTSSLFTSSSESSYNPVSSTTKSTVVTTTSFTCLSCSASSMIISSSSPLPTTLIETDFLSSTLTSTITSCSEHNCFVSSTSITSESSSESSVETSAPVTLTSAVSSEISSSSFSTIAPKESTSYSSTEILSPESSSSSSSFGFSLVSTPGSSEQPSTTVTTICTVTTDSITNIITSTIVVPSIPTDTITTSSITVNTETTEATETNKTIETTNAEVTTGSTTAETIYSTTQINESNPTTGDSSALTSTELEPTPIDSTATQTSQITITQTALTSTTGFDTPAISTSTEDSSIPAVSTFEGSGNSLGISLLLGVAPFLL